MNIRPPLGRALAVLAVAVAVPTPATAIQVRVAEAAEALDPEGSPLLERIAGISVEDVSLDLALKALDESSGVSFVYSPSRLPKGLVTCECREISVEKALNRLLSGTGLGYSVYGEHVIVEPSQPSPSPSRDLTPQLPTAFASLGPAAALRVPNLIAEEIVAEVSQVAQGTITGRVIDALTQAPISTAQIQIPDLQIGTLSGATGTFVLPNVPVGTHTVLAELIGYRQASQEVTIAEGGTVTVEFQLSETAIALEELVVVGYGTQTQATITGSVSALETEEITRTNATTGVEALVGKLPGVHTRMITGNGGITSMGGFGGTAGADARPTDGRPGAITSMQIRNLGEPLYVIDGVPREELDFQQINIQDIENISILKDASAAVYGFRAANGVVLVTTKQGDRDRAPTIDVSASYGWQSLTRFPYEDLQDAYHYLFGREESAQNRGGNHERTAAELELWRQGGPGYESYNTYKGIVNQPNAPMSNFNGSVSGGTSNMTYRFSMGRVDQQYVMKGNEFERTNVQADLRAEIADGLTVGTQLSGRLELHDNIGYRGDNDVMRWALLGINSHWPHEQPWTGPNNNLINGEVSYLTRNPATYTREASGYQQTTGRNVSGNVFAEYAMPHGLQASAKFSYGYNANQLERHRYSFDAYCHDTSTDSYYVCQHVPAADRRRNRSVTENTFGQLQLSHQAQLGGHAISSLVGFEWQGSETNYTDITAVPPLNENDLIDFVDVNSLATDWRISRRASVIGKFNYDYDQRYLVEAVGRYDGSYLYAADNRWGFFPGLSLGWRLTREPALADKLGFLDELKVRASWGESAREQGVNPWDYLGGATYGTGTGAVLDGNLVVPSRPRGLPVTNLTWVKSISKNIGADFALLDNRLSGSIDVFERKLTGLPAERFDVVLPDEAGYSLPDENLESEAVQGMEAILTYTDRAGDLSYSVSPHFTVSRNKILDRYNEGYGNSYERYLDTNGEGRWDGTHFDYHAIGQFQSVEEIENWPVDIDGQGNRTLLPGDIIFEDINGDGLINSYDQRTSYGYAESGLPLLSMGLNTSFGYRGFSLSVDFAGATMFSYDQEFEMRFPYQGDHNSQGFFLDRWHRVDPYNDQSEWIPGRFPPVRIGGSQSSTRNNNSFYRISVWYMRLKNVELGYDLPPQFGTRLGLGRTHAFLSISNPYSFDNMGVFHVDPEIVQGSALNYPTQRVITFGLRATVGGG